MVRSVSISQKPDYEKAPYIIQTVLILLAPALYAASIYMVLGRIIRFVQAESYSLIRPNWLTKIFVSGDVISFLVQAIGGAMLAGADSKSQQDLGQTVVVVGLFVQIVVFSLFVVVTALFHRRIVLRPTLRSESVQVPWLRYIYILYAVSALIMIRSIFRVAEFIQGKGGELMGNEVYFYVLDTVLMLFVSVIFNFYHPHTIIPPANKEAVALAEAGSEASQEVV